MTTFDQRVKNLLRTAIEKYGTAKALSLASGVSTSNISRWLRDRDPRVSEIAPILDLIGAELSSPNPDPARDVCFVSAKVMPAGENVAPPEAEDYIAAPMVGEVGAGPGYVPQEEIKSWLLVYKNEPAIMSSRNLIAVEIGDKSTSMQPLLNPGDIVLVNRDDIDVSRAGRIMLVRDPNGDGMVKRVSVSPSTDRRDFFVQFYSDNAAENPPLLYSLRADYGGEISNAIVGHVIWVWSDMRGK